MTHNTCQRNAIACKVMIKIKNLYYFFFQLISCHIYTKHLSERENCLESDYLYYFVFCLISCQYKVYTYRKSDKIQSLFYKHMPNIKGSITTFYIFFKMEMFVRMITLSFMRLIYFILAKTVQKSAYFKVRLFGKNRKSLSSFSSVTASYKMLPHLKI